MCATRLIPVAVKLGLSGSAPLIDRANSGLKLPWTVETLTPTFSNTLPFISPCTPPPVSVRPVSAPSPATLERCHGVYSNAASLPASRSIASNSAQMPSRRLSNQVLARAVKGLQSVIGLQFQSGASTYRLALAKACPIRQGKPMVPLSFAHHEFALTTGNPRATALYWPAENALLVADLHLEKASWFAARGQLLPPYDSRETLERIALAQRQTGARRVYCLGDSFHDANGPARLEPHAAGMLAALVRVADWVWITGNHDATLDLAGTVVEELSLGGIHLRHEARPGETAPELSGHYHPKLRLTVRGRAISRPCAVRSDNRMILPAFGALTGGMDAGDPVILSALQPAARIDAVLPAAGKLVQYPLWRAA
jgi:DNA ligase-associated metallophosphoesterase